MMHKVTEAVIYAATKHVDVFDKAGEPYFLHPMRIMLEFKCPVRRIIAVLHDTVEDTDATLEEIESLFGKEVREGVDALTRREGEAYMDFIRRCSLSKYGRQGKLMDIKDNTRPDRYNPSLSGLQGRYMKAQALLVDAMKDGDADDVQFLFDKGYIPYYEYMMLMESK